MAEPRRCVSLDELRHRRLAIHRAATHRGISNVRVFGSVARGEADEHSDLDLLVDIERGGLFELGEFAFDVQELLGVFTQVVTVAGLKARMRERVLAEAIPV